MLYVCNLNFLSMEGKTHWKTLRNPDFFGAYVMVDLGADIVVTFTTVSKELVTVQDGKAEEHTIARTLEQKPWILNSINQKVISSVLGTPFVEEWAGKRVQVYAAEVRAFGENVEAVRVRKHAPKIIAQPVEVLKQELEPSHEQWDGWHAAISSGTSALEDAAKHYTISNKNAILLKKK